ncbi:MAG: exodeoxyribonuclease V subunit alpha [Stenotrophomonas sp.]
MNLWQALTVEGGLRAVDTALAHSLARLRPATDPLVLAAAALAAHAVANGHAALKLSQAGSLLDAALPWPEPGQWQQALLASPWVTTPQTLLDPSAAEAVLVLEGDLLYLRRYREFERRLALGLQRLGAAAVPPLAADALVPLFSRLFAQPENDQQAHAAAMALRHPLLLVTGGPGTGKTTTIARLLVLLAAQAQANGQPPLRIGLAAPTGRAAERMAESLRVASARLQAQAVDGALLAVLQGSGSTVHRLLGVMADTPEFRHNADNPLPLDVLVVDEASMMGLPLMTRLVEALASGTRVILLGDPDQLPSVDTGDVLAALLRASGSGLQLPAGDARALAALLGPVAVAGEDAPGTPSPARRVHLQRGWRQSEQLDLAPLASACRQGDAPAALALLRGGQQQGVHWYEDQGDALVAGRTRLLAHARSLRAAADPVAALARANELRLLTAVREGPQGAATLNTRIEALLRDGGERSPWFAGRLLLITENSYRHRLFNGDVGVCFPDAGGKILAWFPGDAEGAPRAFHPAALPAHDSAFAMTVHKAQGSEYGTVWLQLPMRDNRVLSRELVYTAITRARDALHVAGSADVLGLALARHADRWSGLEQRLLG